MNSNVMVNRPVAVQSPRLAASSGYLDGMPNHLAGETSPYLLQHANNPVDWYPWDSEALARAKSEGKPILLSIGYAACHWCHVMAHESVEDPTVAAVMNDNFVNIKVDREERPDLDSVYMRAVQAMTGHGGWPMTVFLTPAGEPFYGGTYFPPVDRQGMPSFTRVLQGVADAYQNRKESISSSVASVGRIYDAVRPEPAGDAKLDERALESAYRGIARQYDALNGGLEGAPKFPPTMLLDFLLRHWARTGEQPALEMAHETFIKMARGGIYDQIGGGFARYSVDERWLVPHFEKMLYDNALLIRFGAHLFQATKDDEVRRVTEETIDWLAREMTSPEGGFYSSFDADSEGEEGKFYVWSAAELDSVLGDDSAAVKAYYGVTKGGNFDGHNILNVPADMGVAAARANTGTDTMREVIARARPALYAERAQRVWPGRDEKVLGSWNGLALRGVIEAARTFTRGDFAQLGARNADFLLTQMVRDGRVMRTHKDGVTRIPGFLEDQAAVALGMLAMFEQSPEPRWIEAARDLARVMHDEFWNADLNAFFDTSRDAEQLVTRPRDVMDNAIPSGTSLAVELLLRLADYDGNDAYRERAWMVMNSLAEMASRYPSAFGHLLGDAEYAATFACHGDYCDMPSPRALDIARASAVNTTL
ncbi:MAG: thioredoxin domain-containing protein [Gemmatimonadaceae bacterium]